MLHQNSAKNPKRIVSWFDGFIAHFHAFPPIFGMKIRKFQQSSPWFPTQQKRGPILGKVLPLIRGIPLSTKVPLCRSLWAIPSMPFEPVTVQKFVRHVHHTHAKNKTDLKYQKLLTWKKKERPGQQNHIQRKNNKNFCILLQASFNPVGGPLKELAPFIGGAGGSAGFLAAELAELGVAGEVAEVLGTLAFRKWKHLKRKPKQNPKCPIIILMMLIFWKWIIIHDDTWTKVKVVIWKVTSFSRNAHKICREIRLSMCHFWWCPFRWNRRCRCRGIHLLSLCLRRFRRFRYRRSRVKRFWWYGWVLRGGKKNVPTHWGGWKGASNQILWTSLRFPSNQRSKARRRSREQPETAVSRSSRLWLAQTHVL